MYRGREGQWAFYLHRLSGLAILVYLCIHIVNIGSFMFGEEVFSAVNALHHSPIFTVGLLLVTAGVLYHSINGLRIILIDFTGRGLAYQRPLWYGTMVLTLLGTAYAASVVLPRLFEGK